MNTNTVVGATQFSGAGKFAQNKAAKGYAAAQKGVGVLAKQQGKAVQRASQLATKSAKLDYNVKKIAAKKARKA